MRTSKSFVPVCVVLLSILASAAPPFKAPVAPPKPLPGPCQSSYLKRVETISNEMKPAVADMWSTFGKMEDLHSVMAKRARRDGDASLSEQQEWAKLKTAMAATAQNIRANTRRLRAISPVPRSLKKMDTELVDAS